MSAASALADIRSGQVDRRKFARDFARTAPMPQKPRAKRLLAGAKCTGQDDASLQTVVKCT
jgi:hypothetical protein